MSRSPVIVGVGGFASNVGKTTLMCDLLRVLPGWEAIKTTRGHYRSCGKDPQGCCVSHLLSDEPVVRSGRQETYESGKDTGRYWDAGAANVHWVITTEQQVEKGIKSALERVNSKGVVIEGNSFTQFVKVDYLLMVVRGEDFKIKSSARRALSDASALYLSGMTEQKSFFDWSKRCGLADLTSNLPVYSEDCLSRLFADLSKVTSSICVQTAALRTA